MYLCSRAGGKVIIGCWHQESLKTVFTGLERVLYLELIIKFWPCGPFKHRTSILIRAISSVVLRTRWTIPVIGLLNRNFTTFWLSLSQEIPKTNSQSNFKFWESAFYNMSHFWNLWGNWSHGWMFGRIAGFQPDSWFRWCCQSWLFSRIIPGQSWVTFIKGGRKYFSPSYKQSLTNFKKCGY